MYIYIHINVHVHIYAHVKTYSQFEIEAMFEFSQNIGTTYVGIWLNFRTLRITITDSTGAHPPVLDQLTIRVRPCRQYLGTYLKTCIEDIAYCAQCDCCVGDLRNFPRTSAPTAVVSPTLKGDFGPCRFSIVNITAFDALNYDSSLDDGDAIMVYFSEPVDKACGRAYLLNTCKDGKYLGKAEVDRLLTFSHFLAANYSAVWHSSMQLQITLLNVTKSQAQIGQLTISIAAEANGDGRLPGMRNVPPVCAPRTITSLPVSGNWGLSPPFINDFRAVAGDNPADSVYGNSDEIVIDVCAGGRGSRGEGGCAPTNTFNFETGQVLGKTSVLRMFAFSQDLGTDYEGVWENQNAFRIRYVFVDINKGGFLSQFSSERRCFEMFNRAHHIGRIHTYTHAYTHKHTHTHTYTYMHTLSLLRSVSLCLSLFHTCTHIHTHT